MNAKNWLGFFLTLGMAATISGCLYTNVHGPWAYRAPTPAEVKSAAGDEMASAEACSQGLLYLVAWGNGGYAAAVQKALAGKPEAILYDVKTDVHVSSYVLGLYTRSCTVVSGKVGHL